MNESQTEAFNRKGGLLIAALREEMTKRFGDTLASKRPDQDARVYLVAADGTTVTLTDTYIACVANQPVEYDWASFAAKVLDDRADQLESEKQVNLTGEDGP